MDNEILMPGDMFSFEWIKDIDLGVPALITIIGVFQYFDEEKVCDFINELKKRFNDFEMIFDAMTYKALRYANDYVKKTGNDDAFMNFGVDDPGSFALKNDLQLLEVIPIFKVARKMLGRYLKIYTRIAMRVVDEGSRRAYLIHLKREGEQE